MAETPITWLVVNSASGSNDEPAAQALIRSLETAGSPPQRVLRCGDEPMPDRAALEAAGVGLLAIFAGDGTANRTIIPLYGWRGSLLVLPGGTQNLLARALHGERTADEIVAGLAAGSLRRVCRPVLRCSAGDALCEIVAGPGAAFANVREGLRGGELGETASALVDAIEKSTAGPTVAIVEPPLGKAEGYPAIRLYPDGDAMAVDGYDAEGALDYARHTVAVLVQRDFREGPHDTLGRHHAVELSSAGVIELMLDGEPATGGTVERIVVSACDLTFLAAEEPNA